MILFEVCMINLCERYAASLSLDFLDRWQHSLFEHPANVTPDLIVIAVGLEGDGTKILGQEQPRTVPQEAEIGRASCRERVYMPV
jgi:hypothetical protein